MIQSLIQDLLDTAAELSTWAERRQAALASLAPLEGTADRVAKAWSGSPIGYQSCVYYRDFRQPPAGAHFSPEWGLENYSGGSTGEWQHYEYGVVLQHIYAIAGDPDLSEPEEISKCARGAFEEGKSQLLSVLTALLPAEGDSFLESIKAEVEQELALTRPQAMRAQLPSGSLWSRDSLAMSQGIRTAPHQEIYAEVVSLHAPFTECEKLARLARRAAHHMQRVVRTGKENSVTASRVFIGHGHSAAWRDLKDFLSERLHLHWDEFQRVSPAGVPTTERLKQMLDSSTFAFLVLTAEDDRTDGNKIARQNVVHEAGLFQGRLGFSRAIVLLEEECEEFSNIPGLGQIRFPAGDISAKFEEVRQVLEREGLL